MDRNLFGSASVDMHVTDEPPTPEIRAAGSLLFEDGSSESPLAAPGFTPAARNRRNRSSTPSVPMADAIASSEPANGAGAGDGDGFGSALSESTEWMSDPSTVRRAERSRSVWTVEEPEDMSSRFAHPALAGNASDDDSLFSDTLKPNSLFEDTPRSLRPVSPTPPTPGGEGGGEGSRPTGTTLAATSATTSTPSAARRRNSFAADESTAES